MNTRVSLSLLTRLTSQGAFESHIAQYQPKDPRYEETVDANGKTRKVEVS
jgi:hypothetical protein